MCWTSSLWGKDCVFLSVVELTVRRFAAHYLSVAAPKFHPTGLSLFYMTAVQCIYHTGSPYN
jgi:hypothetical protein